MLLTVNYSTIRHLMQTQHIKTHGDREVFKTFTVIDFRTPLSRNALCRSALKQTSSIIRQLYISSRRNILRHIGPTELQSQIIGNYTQVHLLQSQGWLPVQNSTGMLQYSHVVSWNWHYKASAVCWFVHWLQYISDIHSHPSCVKHTQWGIVYKQWGIISATSVTPVITVTILSALWTEITFVQALPTHPNLLLHYLAKTNRSVNRKQSKIHNI